MRRIQRMFGCTMSTAYFHWFWNIGMPQLTSFVQLQCPAKADGWSCGCFSAGGHGWEE